MKNKKLPPIHPGEILREEFLEPMGISQYRLAKDISVPPRRINEIVHGKRSITADTRPQYGVRPRLLADMIWNDGKIRIDMILKTVFLRTKGLI